MKNNKLTLKPKDMFKTFQNYIRSKIPFEVGRFAISWKNQIANPSSFLNTSNYPIGVIHDRTGLMDDLFFTETGDITLDWIFSFLEKVTHTNKITTYEPESKEDIENLMLQRHPFHVKNYIVSVFNERLFLTPDKKLEMIGVVNCNEYMSCQHDDYKAIADFAEFLSKTLE